MIPAPVTRSATTVPGSGIAVGGLTPGLGGYMFLKSPAGAVSAGSIAGCATGSAIGAADSTPGTCCTGSAIGAADSTPGTCCTGSAIGAADSTTGTCGTGSAIGADSITGTCGTGSAIGADSITGTCGTGSDIGADSAAGDGALLSQVLEKFSDPQGYCAEAGGAAAR